MLNIYKVTTDSTPIFKGFVIEKIYVVAADIEAVAIQNPTATSIKLFAEDVEILPSRLPEPTTDNPQPTTHNR